MDQEAITQVCQQKFGHLEKNIPQFVEEIIQHILYYNHPGNAIEISRKSLVKEEINARSFLTPVNYRLGQKCITILYENENIKFAIHPLLAHLETDNRGKENHILECFEKENLVIVKYNGNIIEAFTKDKMEYYTGNVRQLMYSILYEKDFNDWMAMLHASGIVSKGQALLFSAESGSGKSTISAILKAKGYDYLGDDFIATDVRGKAYPFPAAISVKQGSVKVLSGYYPELKKVETKETFIGKQVKYLPVHNINKESMKGAIVKAFVFVNYSKSDNFSFKQIDKRTALQSLLKETWVNPKPEFVTGFFEWIEKTEFYHLNYSNTDEALEVVNQIFNP